MLEVVFKVALNSPLTNAPVNSIVKKQFSCLAGIDISVSVTVQPLCFVDATLNLSLFVPVIS